MQRGSGFKISQPWAWALGILLLIVLVQSVGHQVDRPNSASANSSDPTSAPDSTDAPPPPPDMHAKRAEVRTWYLKIVDATSLARAAAEVSGDLISAGNTTDASSVLKQASTSAETAENESLNGPEDDWSDVAQQFNESSGKLKDAINGLRNGLDDDKPSTFADAKESLESAISTYSSAVHGARIKYEGMGGKWSDLPDGQDMEKGMVTLLRANVSQ